MEIIGELFRETEEVKVLTVAIKCVYEFMAIGERVGEGSNGVLEEFRRQKGFVDRLEMLQYHTDGEVYGEVSKVIQRFMAIE